MISVCIPVFNVDVRNLAETLKEQSSDLPAEIILIDDGSDKKYRDLNANLQNKGIRYYQLEENIGRSRIRNRFAGYAEYEHLLFLDCDSVVISDRFLEEYAKAAVEFPGRLICGGRIYSPEPPGRNRRLHWKYGIRKESQPVEVRKKDPNRSFMTNNFLIPIHVLKQIPFDERLSGYGHEDSLFGHELTRQGYSIVHIDNPVLHGELEPNREFLNKTRDAVQNLVLITELLKDDTGFTESITLLKIVSKLKSRGLAGLVRMSSMILVPFSRLILFLGFSSLKMLDIYKLGLYLILKRRG